MELPNSIDVITKTYSGAESLATLTVQRFTKTQVLLRTTIRTVLIGAVAVLSMGIPIVHLITIPVGLVVIVLTLTQNLKRTAIIAAGALACPSCKGIFRYAERNVRFPFKELCDHCHREIVVSLAPQGKIQT
jgi:hypothetical protein